MIAIASPNIAFIKYWGKLGSTTWNDKNLARNSSLSLTLSQAQTRTEVRMQPSGLTSDIHLGGVPASAADVKKITEHLRELAQHLGRPTDHFFVRSENNFPAGTGLASSASGFAALTLAGAGALGGRELAESFLSEQNFEFSRLARRGSGSACRSVAGPFMKWQGEGARTISSDWKLYDTIILFSKTHKKVPSSEGHKTVLSSPLFNDRLKRIPARLAQVETAIAQKSIDKLGPLLETEAQEMHAVSESGHPPALYRSAATDTFLASLFALPQRDFYYTLDAGPNIHIISARDVTNEINDLLRKSSLEAEVWKDWTGHGPMLYFGP